MSDGSFCTYVLKSSKTGRHYTGSCQDLDERFAYHNEGYSLAARGGLPWVVVYREPHATREAACARERYFKTGAGRDELKRPVMAAAW
jgi:putative endonuclease